MGLDAGEVTCPAGKVAAIRPRTDGPGLADFAAQCTGCPLRASCTTSSSGRTVTIHAREDLLQSHKAAQADPDWQEAYTGTRPKVERKIAHFVRRPWGGRRARFRGQARIATDADTRAAAINWSRLATLGVNFFGGAWTTAPPGATIDPPPLRPSPPLRDPRTPENPPKDTGGTRYRGVRGADRLPGQLPITPVSVLHAIWRADWPPDHLYFRSLLGLRVGRQRPGREAHDSRRRRHVRSPSPAGWPWPWPRRPAAGPGWRGASSPAVFTRSPGTLGAERCPADVASHTLVGANRSLAGSTGSLRRRGASAWSFPMDGHGTPRGIVAA